MSKYYTFHDALPGCLADNEPMIFTRKSDAIDCAADAAEGYRECELTVIGSKKTGVWYVEEQGRYIEVVDISNQVRPCGECQGSGDNGKGYCYSCDDSGLETW